MRHAPHCTSRGGSEQSHDSNLRWCAAFPQTHPAGPIQRTPRARPKQRSRALGHAREYPCAPPAPPTSRYPPGAAAPGMSVCIQFIERSAPRLPKRANERKSGSRPLRHTPGRPSARTSTLAGNRHHLRASVRIASARLNGSLFRPIVTASLPNLTPVSRQCFVATHRRSHQPDVGRCTSHRVLTAVQPRISRVFPLTYAPRAALTRGVGTSFSCKVRADPK